MPELRALPPSQGEETELRVRMGMGVMTNDPGCRAKDRTQAQISHLLQAKCLWEEQTITMCYFLVGLSREACRILVR